MSDWEIKHLQSQLDRETKNLQYKLERLDETVRKESTSRFIWLMLLSNILFWLFIADIDLRHDLKVTRLDRQHEQAELSVSLRDILFI